MSISSRANILPRISPKDSSIHESTIFLSISTFIFIYPVIFTPVHDGYSRVRSLNIKKKKKREIKKRKYLLRAATLKLFRSHFSSFDRSPKLVRRRSTSRTRITEQDRVFCMEMRTQSCHVDLNREGNKCPKRREHCLRAVSLFTTKSGRPPFKNACTPMPPTALL